MPGSIITFTQERALCRPSQGSQMAGSWFLRLKLKNLLLPIAWHRNLSRFLVIRRLFFAYLPVTMDGAESCLLPVIKRSFKINCSVILPFPHIFDGFKNRTLFN